MTGLPFFSIKSWGLGSGANVGELVPPRGGDETFPEHAEVEANGKLSVVRPPLNQGLPAALDVPQAHRHVVGAARHQVAAVRTADHLPHRVAVPRHHSHGHVRLPDVPHPHGFVDGARHYRKVVVLAPVTAQDFEVVRANRERARGLPDVPELEGAVPAGAREGLAVRRAPRHRVAAIPVLRERADRPGSLEAPQLDRVVPARAKEAVAVDEVPVHAVDLVAVLLEAPDGVQVRGRRDVPDFYAAVAARRGEDVLIPFAPRAVVEAVYRVEGADLPQALRRGVKHVLLPVPDDPEVLRRRHRDAALVVGRELDRVSIKPRLVKHPPPFRGSVNAHGR
eukprot:CAMPEP_0197499968 /NCGR_PEP_ID=MMETSP1311-20131121/61290_1 /TAXON_ID=464262 /ORGANISM="Genus nov. species nov., Strain RCC856" /LENGTH=336 /DNA_ID=CAMNT_0043045717 /DNA_START=683 /DNA_END=1690 /DNA_ORIENTATION=-